MICNKHHLFWDRLSDLPDSQSGISLNKCAGCAYDQGFEDASNGRGRHYSPDLLYESKEGPGKHKNAGEAYILGYADGAKAIREQRGF